MEKLMLGLDKLLSFLPFDGDKTVIGAGIKLLMPVVVVHFPLLAVMGPVVDAASDLFIALGIAHKAVKSQSR